MAAATIIAVSKPRRVEAGQFGFLEVTGTLRFPDAGSSCTLILKPSAVDLVSALACYADPTTISPSSSSNTTFPASTDILLVQGVGPVGSSTITFSRAAGTTQTTFNFEAKYR